MVSTLSTVVIDPPEGDMGSTSRRSSGCADLPARTLYPAHGAPAPAAAAKLDEYLEHRRACGPTRSRRRSPRAGRSPRSPRAAYDDTPPFLLPVAERSCLATLLRLEAEGRVRRDGETWRLNS